MFLFFWLQKLGDRQLLKKIARCHFCQSDEYSYRFACGSPCQLFPVFFLLPSDPARPRPDDVEKSPDWRILDDSLGMGSERLKVRRVTIICITGRSINGGGEKEAERERHQREKHESNRNEMKEKTKLCVLLVSGGFWLLLTYKQIDPTEIGLPTESFICKESSKNLKNPRSMSSFHRVRSPSL